MSIVLGGPDAWRVHRKGQFVLALQHVGIGDGEDEPALVIWPSRPAPGAGAMVICLSAVGQYLDSKTGMPTPHAIASYQQALEAMKLSSTDRYAVRQLCDIVFEFAPDLIRMPPRIQRAGLPAEVEAITAYVDGQKVGEMH